MPRPRLLKLFVYIRLCPDSILSASLIEVLDAPNAICFMHGNLAAESRKGAFQG